MIRLLSAVFRRVCFDFSFGSSLRVMLLLQYKIVLFLQYAFSVRFVLIHLQTIEVSRFRVVRICQIR